MKARPVKFRSKLPVAAVAALLVAALLVAACASPSFSYLDGRRWHRAQLNTYDAIILSVDGKHYTATPVMVDPGQRKIVVQAPPAAGFHYGESRTFDLNVEPCTRYYIAARKASPLAQDFEPYVDYQEPIAGCRASEKK